MRTQLRVVVAGRVQGVWYRAWTAETAEMLGLDGWVRNRLDGTVEAVFAGAPDKVEAMVRACRDGPPAARVTEIARFEHDEEVAPGFRTLPTR